MAAKHYPKGLDGRMRDQDGEIRQKRSDTNVETLRKTYGEDFAKGYRSDAQLGTGDTGRRPQGGPHLLKKNK